MLIEPRFLAAFVLLFAGGCAVGPDYERPAMSVPAAFKEAPPPEKSAAPADLLADRKANLAPLTDEIPAGSGAPPAATELEKAKPQDDAARGKWWEVFNDADLNALEEQVALHNQNVKAAEASFHEARALVAEARAAYFPTIGADASLSRSGSGAHSTAVATGASALAASIRNSYSASLDASWVPDFWGRIRREVEASKAGAEAGAADLASATLSAQAELAIDYLDLRVADEQKRLLDRTIEAYTKSLEITQNQYKAGIAVSSDVLQAKVQLENAEAQAVDVGAQRAQYEHAIAVLVGKTPAEFSIAVNETIPPLPPVPQTVPSELLERRPDIAAAERNVAAANAEIGVAEAAYFPDITLAASGGYENSALAKLFTLPNRFWSIGPSLVETLFDAGLRSAQTEAAIATYDQTVANYRQTVLTAFQEVEDNLAGLRIYAQEAEVLDGAVKDAEQTVAVFLNQYKSGTVSYLNVASAQTTALNDELTALNLRKTRLTAAATLIEDLGGGWDASALDKPAITQGETTPFSLLPPEIHRP